MGAVTPLGNDLATSWRALLAGRSGVRPISRFAPADLPVRIAGEVRDFRCDPAIDARAARRMALHVQYALNATLEALRAARLAITAENADQVGVCFGSGAGGLEQIIAQQAVLEQQGPRRVAPQLIANMIVDAASGWIALQTGARGPNMAVAAACATGAGNVGEACEIIRRGDAAAMIAGGSEAPILPLVLASFANARSLAADNEHPARACKPFDARRDGFVLAEGAAALVLEDLEHARRRSAPILAEIVGYAAGNDAFHMITPDAQGAGVARAMRRALHKAEIAPEQIDYVNAHGTGTVLNDRSETRALHAVFGAYARQLAISSTKSMSGHMMGAAGAFEAQICVLALHDGLLPPTINYAQPDPDCDLDYLPNQARHQAITIAISNSIGLGGHNTCLVFRRPAP
jgi:beta-ketoacyl-acyl-carrier-protein synthase II